jgi:hypothetical protein
MPEGTVGVSTYLTSADAEEKAGEMEVGYQRWLRLRERLRE